MNLGKVVATRGVADSAAENPEFAAFVVNSLSRYIRGDWGDLDKEDKEANEAAMNGGDARILAAYNCPFDPNYKIWIITEWDRSSTTILFPDEY